MVQDLARFMEEERRRHIFCHVIDLYLPDHTDQPDLKNNAYIDATGYYAMNRFIDGVPVERQVEVFGGLKWRYSEHVPWSRQRIDRIPFFKAQKGCVLDEDFRFNDPEMNTYACPWHHNVTCAIASYRTAKSLLRNPGSSAVIDSFMWDQSVRFEWHSKQFMQLGMIGAGAVVLGDFVQTTLAKQCLHFRQAATKGRVKLRFIPRTACRVNVLGQTLGSIPGQRCLQPR